MTGEDKRRAKTQNADERPSRILDSAAKLDQIVTQVHQHIEARKTLPGRSRPGADTALMVVIGGDEESVWSLLEQTFASLAEFQRFAAEDMQAWEWKAPSEAGGGRQGFVR